VPKTFRPVPVGYADVAWLLSLSGDPEPIVVTCSMDLPTAPVGATANSLFDAFKTPFTARIGSAYNLDGVHVLYQDDASHQLVADSTNPTFPFTGSATTFPQNCAYLLRKNTLFAGRKFRGRMYIPGVGEADAINTGEIASATLTALNTAAVAFFVALSAIGTPVLIHSTQYEEGEVPETPEPPTVVTSFQFDDFIATQRRRLRR